MREEVGRSIGLSARKVQVRASSFFVPHPSLIFDVDLPRSQVWFQASRGVLLYA
jgi:hypothetical protein